MKWMLEAYVRVLSTLYLTPRVVLLWFSIFAVLVGIGFVFDTKMRSMQPGVTPPTCYMPDRSVSKNLPENVSPVVIVLCDSKQHAM